MRTLIKAFSIILCCLLAIPISGDVVVVVGRGVPAGGAYTPGTVYFAGDGQCWMERDNDELWGADDNEMYFSVWIKPDAAGAGTLQFIMSRGDDGFRLYLGSSDQFIMYAESTANTEVVQLRTTATITRDGNTWTHVFGRFDRAVDNQGEMYVNGTLSTTITTFLSTAEHASAVDLTTHDTSIGGELGGSTTTDYGGCLADLWVSRGNTYANITVSDFISAGDPVDLGATGTGPDGSQPVVFLKGNGTGFTVNSGSGGDFVKKGTTALTTCSTTP